MISDEVASPIHDGGRARRGLHDRRTTDRMQRNLGRAPWHAASDLAPSVCEDDSRGLAIVDAEDQTGRPGVWAVGNATTNVVLISPAPPRAPTSAHSCTGPSPRSRNRSRSAGTDPLRGPVLAGARSRRVQLWSDEMTAWPAL